MPSKQNNTLIRTKSEIMLMSRAGRAAADAIVAMKQAIHDGEMNTLELDRIAQESLKKSGAKPSFLWYKPPFGTQPYPAASCISVNQEVVHGIPNANKNLMLGDIVTLDIGANIGGLHADTVVTIVVGESANALQKHIIKATNNALKQAILSIKPNQRIGCIGHIISQIAQKNQLSLADGLSGHFIGPEVHIDPIVPNDSKRLSGIELLPGMTFCIEPMFCYGSGLVILDNDGWTVRTSDRQLSAHFEHTISINDRGTADILTLPS